VQAFDPRALEVVTSKAQKILDVEKQIDSLTKEREKLLGAVGPRQSGYADGRRVSPTPYTQFEIAAIKRANAVARQIADAEDTLYNLRIDFLEEMAGKVNEEVDQDPETLLRASLSVMHRLYKKGHKEPEQLVLMRMLVEYIRSLKDDDD